MRRPHPTFLAGLAGSVLAASGILFLITLWGLPARWREVAGTPALGGVLAGVLGLFAIAAIGRIVLSLLPPGPLGSHTPRDLLTTWAAAHALGSLAVCFELVLLPARPGPGYAALFAAPWGVLLAVRLLTLPGAMVPGRATIAEPTRGAARALGTAWALVMAAATLLAVLDAGRIGGASFGQEGPGPAELGLRWPLLPHVPESFLAWLAPGGEADAARLLWLPATAVAAIAFLARALRDARRAPLGRNAVLLAVALGVAPAILYAPWIREPLTAAALLGMGASASVPWIRRADRRACWGAGLLYAGAALAAAPWLAAAGLLGLVVATPRPARRHAATVATISAAGAGLVLWRASALGLELELFSGGLSGTSWTSLPGVLFSLPFAFYWPAFAVAVLSLVWSLRERGTAQPAGRADEPRRELLALGLPLAAGVLLAPWSGEVLAWCLTLLFPVGALFTALVLVRSERTTSA